MGRRVWKRSFVRHFHTKTRGFTKTGSGQTQGIAEKERGVLFSAGNFVRLSNALYNTPGDFERLRDAVAELIVEQQTS